MATREEIKEGIANIIMDCGDDNWKHCLIEADLIVKYLHSQGVVLRVDRELPEVAKGYKDFGGNDTIWEESQQDMLKWHNDSLEPLIEEVNNERR